MATRKIDNFELRLVPMGVAHIPRLHELSIAVNWPHRPEDWAAALSLGEGVVALDEIDRPVSSAMFFPVGRDIATIGMVITSPRLQDQGAAGWLMGEMLRRTKGHVRRLNATKAAYRLYVSLGFQPVAEVYQHQGIARAPTGHDARVRPLEGADRDRICDVDLRAYGSDRSRFIDHFLATAEGTVLESDGGLTGYALCHRFGRGHVLGPVVAVCEEDAVALIRPLIAAHRGAFLRMDTRMVGGPLQAALEAAGMSFFDTVTTMQLGATAPPAGPAVYGLAGHAFG